MSSILPLISLIIGVALLFIAFALLKVLMKSESIDDEGTYNPEIEDSVRSGIFIEHGMVETENGVIPQSKRSMSFLKLIV